MLKETNLDYWFPESDELWDVENELREVQSQPFGRDLVREAELLVQRSYLREQEKTYTAVAKAICSQCPLRSECLSLAMRNKETFGIWGGLTPRERSQLRRQR